MKRPVYDFWAYDIATDVAKEVLENLGIPFKVETEKRIRDPKAPKDLGDTTNGPRSTWTQRSS